MQITDTIADLLTRIRNANSAKHDSVEIPASNLKKSICQILVDEGYVKNFTVIEDGKQGVIKVSNFNDIQAGDIVVVRGHVGIAAGGGTVIDASSSNGKVVHRGLSSWWRSNFVCAWRIF